MQFARIGAPGAEVPVVLNDGKFYSLAPVTADIDSGFWEAGGPERAAAAFASGDLPELDLPEQDQDAARIGSPIARPSSVICIGMNYAAHAAESGSAPPA